MSSCTVSKVYKSDLAGNTQVNRLLESEGIHRDKNLDYTCAIYDDDQIIATGSCFGNTLRCIAVSGSRRGEALLNTLLTHLMEVQLARGNHHVFLYTKCEAAAVFRDLGFYEIVRVSDEVVFMENRRNGFADYVARIAAQKVSGSEVAALVMNANPFSLGHLYLVEQAARSSDVVHLFVVSEDASLFPYAMRKKLIVEGTKHLKNLVFHDTGSYIISNATFPSYFQKDEESVIRGHALLDLTIFKEIAAGPGINHRYVGHEPNSRVTNIYNEIMKSLLPDCGIRCTEVQRLQIDGITVSASTIRKAIQDGDEALVRALVPKTTADYIFSEAACGVVENIRKTKDVIHH